MSRFTELLARLLDMWQDHSVRPPANRSRAAGWPSRPPANRSRAASGGEPSRSESHRDGAEPSTGAGSQPGAVRSRTGGELGDGALRGGGGKPPSADSLQDRDVEVTSELTLDRIETMVTGAMGYGVQRHGEAGHPCLLGTWDSFPFVIEVPQGHEGWLLVSGDWEETVPAGLRGELASSVNDWNRDRFFPTVSIIDSPAGPLVRATYLMDLSSGVTDTQLRLHLETALSSCTQALTLIHPLLPEL